MNHNKKANTDTAHYILTFLSFVLLAGCFATQLFTGKSALLQFDSLAGSLLLGIIFILYAIWFIYEDIVANHLGVSVAVKTNIKQNPTFIFILSYWIILILVPVCFNIF